jgi:hypothetical protein
VMAYRNCPDCAVPQDELRCEAMTKALRPSETYQIWRRESHRCVRRAVQGRAGRSVCALHARLADVTYHNGEPDRFPWSVRHQRKMMRREA